MKSHYRVVVIGGGIVGASVLYHLARKGWTDIALIERAELTAGSTWHAAAGFHAINDDPHIAALQAYTIELYREIEAESGQSVGMHMPGGYSIATTPERWEWLQAEFAVYQTLGIEARLATPPTKSSPSARSSIPTACSVASSIRTRAPSIRTARRTRLRSPHDNAVRTSSCAIAWSALAPRTDGQWIVTTEHGTVIAGARRQRRRSLGASHRSHGRRRSADDTDAAPLPDHRRPA